jgi:putative ABC transport system permease protein
VKDIAGAGFGIGDGQDYWQAIQIGEEYRVRRGRFTMVIARLKDGVTVEQSQADMKSIAAALATEYPFNVGWTVNVVPMMEQVVGSSRAVLAMVAGAIALVLLIACANVASLTIARALGRRGELTLRTALGATQGRLVRQLTVEGVVLAVLGGALGVLLGYLTIGALRSSAIQQIPRLQDLHLDTRVLVLALLVTTGAGLLCGLLPGLGLRGGSAARTSWARPGAPPPREAAIGFALVLSCSRSRCRSCCSRHRPMIRSLARLLRVDPGFEPRQVLMAEVGPPGSGVQPGACKRILRRAGRARASNSWC